MERTPIEELDIKGIGASKIDGLKEKGYNTIEDLGKASKDDISEVRGLGKGSQNLHKLLTWLHKNGYRDRDKYKQEKERLQQRLEEIFQLDMTEDLDFGTAKVIDMNRSEIEDYIDYELIAKVESQVEKIVEEYEPDELQHKRQKIHKNIGEDVIREDGTISPEHRGIKIVDEYIEMREDAVTKRDARRIMSDVLGYVGDFFTRYYDNGDFIYQEKQRAKGSEYSIPYCGSQTNFYWSTKNQYYARTNNYYQNYRFKSNKSGYSYVLSYEDIDGDDSKGYIMESPSDLEIDVDDKILKAHFERRNIDNSEMEERYGQSRHTEKTASEVHAEEICDTLNEQDTEYEEDSQFIRENIRNFIKETNYDFFIHKNLKKFLNDELDKFVKNEVLEYTSGNYSSENYKEHVATVFYDVSERIIELLARIEEYKKKSYEKKKFVKNSYNLLPLDEFSNVNIDQNLNSYNSLEQMVETESIYSSLNADTVDENSNLMIDSREILSSHINDEPKNKLIYGNNYHAIDLLKSRYKDQIDVIYCDPPYNTKRDLHYKDDYAEPTWLSMMYNRMSIAHELLREEGIIFVSIDNNQYDNLKKILDSTFDKENYITTIVVESTKTQGMKVGAAKDGTIAKNYEYVLCYRKKRDSNNEDNKKIGENVLYDFKSYYDINFSYVLKKDEDSYYKKINIGDYILQNAPDNIISKYKSLDLTDGGSLSTRDVKKGVEVSEEIREYVLNEIGSKIYRRSEANINIESEHESKIEKDRVYEYKDYLLYETSSGNINQMMSLEDSVGWDDGHSPKYGFRTIRGNLWKGFYSDMMNVGNEGGVELKNGKKPVRLIRQLIELVTDGSDKDNEINILDFFAGTGTTAQATIELDNDRKAQYNYILVELMKDSYEKIKKRLTNISHDMEFVNRGRSDEKDNTLDRIRPVECLEIESYEETLETLLQNESNRTNLFDYDELLLDYSLDFDSSLRDSISSFSESLKSEYKLYNGNTVDNVDMETTFNYLTGLRDIEKYSMNFDGVEYTIYEGFDGNQDKVRVIWRDGEVDYSEEKDNIEYESFDHVFVNGDSAIPNAQSISEKINSILTQGDNV